MPELPDLEVFSTNLQKQLAGKTVTDVHVPANKRLKQTESAISKAIKGAKLSKVFREGKELRFEFDNKHIVGMHLMLHGSLSITPKPNEAKYIIGEIVFDNSVLALSDWQKMAQLTLDPEQTDTPDALSGDINADWLIQVLNKKTLVKTLLMDQHVIRGIGNAYADEILWKAGISPFSPGNKIPESRIKLLSKTIPAVLHEAIKNIKKHHPEIITGEVRDFLLIHNPDKKHSPTGAPIETGKVNGRKTFYTNEQELFS